MPQAYYWREQGGGGYRKIDLGIEDHADPSYLAGKMAKHGWFDEPYIGDRVSLGTEVWEINDFGTWDSIASGPAGDGLIGAMEQ